MDIKEFITQNTSSIIDKSIFYILWTGGWDSTFRLVELSRTDCVIQPVYVIDPGRISTQYEQKAMSSILECLRFKNETKAIIFDVIAINLHDIPQDNKITEAYKTIHEKTNLGSQHEWLARLGKIMPGMELGTEAGSPETSHIIDAIQQFCSLDIQNGIGKIDPLKSSPEGILVLGCFSFPIISRYETDMLQLILEWNYQDVMKHIWFCHNPLHGKPCGLCHPCQVKMESKMEWLLPKRAQIRYHIDRTIRNIVGLKAASLYQWLSRKL